MPRRDEALAPIGSSAVRRLFPAVLTVLAACIVHLGFWAIPSFVGSRSWSSVTYTFLAPVPVTEALRIHSLPDSDGSVRLIGCAEATGEFRISPYRNPEAPGTYPITCTFEHRQHMSRQHLGAQHARNFIRDRFFAGSELGSDPIDLAVQVRRIVPYTAISIFAASFAIQFLAAAILFLLAGNRMREIVGTFDLGTLEARVMAATIILAPAAYTVMQSAALASRAGQPSAEATQVTAAILVTPLVVAPILEEVVYRAWMTTLFARIVPAAVAVTVTAGLFMASHQSLNLPTALLTFVLGIFSGWAWIRFRSLIVCAAMHASVNLVIILAAMLR
jgi:membrane protease YdiL (CAAX protease family)